MPARDSPSSRTRAGPSPTVMGTRHTDAQATQEHLDPRGRDQVPRPGPAPHQPRFRRGRRAAGGPGRPGIGLRIRARPLSGGPSAGAGAAQLAARGRAQRVPAGTPVSSRPSRMAAACPCSPALDSRLLRLHIETACRRGGALALMADDLDPAQCLIRLREKGESIRWQPVSPTLMSHLLAHAESRGGLGSGQRLLRYASGRAITSRRYDYLWQRLGCELPWVATQQVSMHWIRPTVLTWVEGRGVASDATFRHRRGDALGLRGGIFTASIPASARTASK